MIDTWGIGDFSEVAFEERWIAWTELAAAISPGRRLAATDPRIPLRNNGLLTGGIYIVAHSVGGRAPRGAPRPAHPAVQYIGKTNLLRRRLLQFGNSAGLWGKRADGHSGGWRWRDEWSRTEAFFALFPVPQDVKDARVGSLWRICREAQALASYARKHDNHCPALNVDGAKELDLD